MPALWALFALGACVGTTPISSTDSPPLAISDCARTGETASAQQVADAAALLAATVAVTRAPIEHNRAAQEARAILDLTGVGAPPASGSWQGDARSEERRVGRECEVQCRSRWAP